MNIIEIVKNLYTNSSPRWMDEIEEVEIQPFVIQHWLIMNDSIRQYVRWLDKYVFTLPPKMYLSLAWSVIPKTEKQPWVKFIKKQEDEEEWEFILTQIRKEFDLSDSDYDSVKERLIKSIKLDMINWFSYYGVPKTYWKQHNIDFNQIKKFGEENKPKVLTLNQWGLSNG